ncbi:MAG: hypothetical protein F4Y26_06560 [Gammaproteobacteria bacterium]|nr:hypothetical protein [Gammaproteobacteria bacterium]
MGIWKWLLIAVAAVVVLFLAMRIYYGLVANPAVVQQLKDDPQGERASIVMLLTLPNGRTLPVNYRREGNRVFAGADGRWWRSLREGNAPVSVWIRGETFEGRAHVALDDPEYKRDVFSRLRPDVPKWLPEWLDAHLVVIELDESA